jgi:serine protease Do
LFDGTRHDAELIAAEPQLDVALLRIKDIAKLGIGELPYFDINQPLPKVSPGTSVLAFSNLFEIATGDEPVSIQQGVISAITPLAARRGVTEVSYKGNVFILDAITNNPGAHGGAVTTRKGELIGLVGKELRNTLTETWVNYALPVQDLTSFVAKAKKGPYQPIARQDDPKKVDGKPLRHGIVLVPDVLDLTPPYIERVQGDSPAAKAGLKADDLIVLMRLPPMEGELEGEDRVVLSCKAFKQALAGLSPGAKVQLTVRRGMQLLNFDITLEEQPKPGR